MRICVICHRVYNSDEEPPICVAKPNEKSDKRVCSGELVEFKYNSIREFHEGEFNRIHIEMAEKYGIKWYNVNSLLVSSVPCLPEWKYHTSENKHAMSLMAIKICEKMEFMEK